MASPYWTAKRERLIGAQYERAQVAGPTDDPDEPDPVEAFRSQWLNIWPDAPSKTSRVEALLPAGTWGPLVEMAETPTTGIVAAVEDNYGRGAAAVAGGLLPDGRAYVWGEAFTTRSEAWAWVELVADRVGGVQLLTGPGLEGDPAGAAVKTSTRSPMGPAQTRTGLALIRSTVTTARLAHDGGRHLADQLASARVVPSPSGGLGPSGSGRADMVRAMAWVLAAIVRTPEAKTPRFVIR